MSEFRYAVAAIVIGFGLGLWALDIPQAIWRASAVRRRANRRGGVFGEGWGRG